jgi:tryptophan synthase beta chain
MVEKSAMLAEDGLPICWYNVLADLPVQLPPPLHPADHRPIVAPPQLHPLLPLPLADQELSTQRWVPIPEEIRAALRAWRPTPLVRATGLERALDTPARIYFKDESQNPAGSHKLNTAIAQAYYAREAGLMQLTTETGGGQWGCALAMACTQFGLRCRVFAVRLTLRYKPYRQAMMRLWGAEVIPSPSPDTEIGRRILAQDPNSPGSIGIAIGEAVETASTCSDSGYAIGSVLNHVLLHQTVIGLETQSQMERLGDRPNVLIGCVGGGSNFAGLVFPYLCQRLEGSPLRFIAAEPQACPTLTRGMYRYEHGDAAQRTPLMKMHTLGREFVPPPIVAAGLRYHGMAPTVSLLVKQGIVETAAYTQRESLEAARLFAATEGYVPALEAAYAICAAVAEARRCRQAGQVECIVFVLSGHGICDLGAYDTAMAVELEEHV